MSHNIILLKEYPFPLPNVPSKNFRLSKLTHLRKSWTHDEKDVLYLYEELTDVSIKKEMRKRENLVSFFFLSYLTASSVFNQFHFYKN